MFIVAFAVGTTASAASLQRERSQLKPGFVHLSGSCYSVDTLSDTLAGGNKRKQADKSTATAGDMQRENTGWKAVDAHQSFFNQGAAGSIPARVTMNCLAR